MDKNQAVIDFLLTCPTISSNPLFFNFINAKDKSKQIIPIATDTSINEKYIDGSVLRRYTFTIMDYCSISYNPVPKNITIPETTTTTDYVSENVADLKMVQDIVDWIKEKADNREYPDFGTDCEIDEMSTTTDIPNLNGVDTQVAPVLAKYSITIQINYLDTSKMYWK